MQPIPGSPNVRVLGGPKSADEVQALTPTEMQIAFQQTDDLFKTGDVERTLSMPALSTPIREIVRIVTALRKFYTLAEKVAALDGTESPSDLSPLVEEAKALIGADQPKPSRLIIPG